MKRKLNIILGLLLISFQLSAQLSFVREEWSQNSKPTAEIDTKQVVHDTIYLRDTIVMNQVDSLIPDSLGKKIGEGIEAAKDSSPKLGQLKKIISWSKIFWAIVFLILAYFVIRFLDFILETFAERSTRYRFILKSISPFIKILGWIMAVFIVIQGIFKPPTETVFAFLASIGIAVGFASQDILKNIFGGIMILFDRPFQVGDKIQIGDDYGEVKEIGLRSTRIITRDDSKVSLPNAEVVNKAVSNANSGEANCQVIAEIYLPIDVDTNKVRQLALEAARVSRYVYLNKPISVLFINEVKERRSYLKMRLKAYVSDIRYEFSFQSDMTEIVMRELLVQELIKKEDLS